MDEVTGGGGVTEGGRRWRLSLLVQKCPNVSVPEMTRRMFG